jgi:hypothetical protein
MSRVAGPRAAQTFLFRLGSSLASCADAVKVGRRSARAAGSTSPGHALRAAVREATVNATGILRKLNLDAHRQNGIVIANYRLLQFNFETADYFIDCLRWKTTQRIPNLLAIELSQIDDPCEWPF